MARQAVRLVCRTAITLSIAHGLLVALLLVQQAMFVRRVMRG